MNGVRYFSVCVFLVFVQIACCVGAEADLYVSPGGDDSWSGRAAKVNAAGTDGPLKTLSRARDAVREFKKSGGKDVTVLLREGKYYLNETVVFGVEDGGVSYVNYPGEKPVICSGVEIKGFRKLQDKIKAMPAKAKGEVWVADVPSGVKAFVTLYKDGKRLMRARSAGFAPVKNWDQADVSTTIFNYPQGVVLKNWDNIGDVELLVRPSFDWAMSIVPLESVDVEKRIAKTSVPTIYPIAKLRTSAKEDVNSIWIENAIEFLDEPGEWVLNSKERKLYIWPLDGKEPKGIFAPQVTELIRVEGNIDHDGPADEPVKNIVFKGITFTQADRYKLPKDKTGWGVQHDWEMFDSASAMVRFRGAENCVIVNCRFVDSGAGAIRLDLHCQNNVIRNNLIANIGGGGILLAGYGPGTKDVNKKNIVVNNYIHHIGQIYWQSLGIFAWQSGENLIVHNLIHNTPYTAIAVTGRIAWDRTGKGECSKTIRWHEVDKIIDPADKSISQVNYEHWKKREQFLHSRKNIVEKNEIRDVMETLCDGNGIYVSGAGKENVARKNYIHHCPSTRMREALRCDDDQYDTTFEKNIVYKTASRGINIKGKNNVINNIVADLSTDRMSHYFALMAYPVDGALVERNIFYSKDKDQKPFQQAPSHNKTRRVPDIKTTKTDYNIYYNTEDPNWVDEHFRQFRPAGVEVHSIFADPMFVDIEKGNFLLKAGSPALKLGFEQIDVRKPGLTKDFPKEFLE